MMLANDEPVAPTTLRDCPFCGNEAITFEPDDGRNIVSCKLGHAPMRSIEGWNFRFNPMREQIERLLKEFEGKRSEFAKHRDAATTDTLRHIADAKAATYGWVLIRLAELLERN